MKSRHLDVLSDGICAAVVSIAGLLTMTRVDAQPTAALPSIPDTAVMQEQIAQRPIWMVGYKWTIHRVGGTPQVESDWSGEVTPSHATSELTAFSDGR